MLRVAAGYASSRKKIKDNKCGNQSLFPLTSIESPASSKPPSSDSPSTPTPKKQSNQAKGTHNKVTDTLKEKINTFFSPRPSSLARKNRHPHKVLSPATPATSTGQNIHPQGGISPCLPTQMPLTSSPHSLPLQSSNEPKLTPLGITRTKKKLLTLARPSSHAPDDEPTYTQSLRVELQAGKLPSLPKCSGNSTQYLDN